MSMYFYTGLMKLCEVCDKFELHVVIAEVNVERFMMMFVAWMAIRLKFKVEF